MEVGLSIIRRIFLFLSVAIFFTSCSGSGDNTFSQVLVFSDVHFNPFYDATIFQPLLAADESEWADIFGTSTIAEASSWGSETNYPLLAFTLSSINPVFDNNPAFKIFTFSNATFEPSDYSSLNFDLAVTSGQFNDYYTFSTAYSLPDILHASFDQLYPLLASDSAQQARYRGYYYSGHDSSNPITDTNWPVYRCGIGEMAKQDLIDCVNGY